jgi:hypothetical protein
MIGRLLARQRLLFPRHAYSRVTDRLYQDRAKPVLAALSVECELHQTYSAQKRSELISHGGQNFLVIDQAQLEHFHLMNALADFEPGDEFVRAAMMRPIGESLREAGQLELSLVFLGWAMRAKALLREIQAGNPKASAIHWQHLVVMFHEAGHAMPDDHPMKEALHFDVGLVSSQSINERIMSVNDAMLDLLKGTDEKDKQRMSYIGIADSLASQSQIDDATQHLMAKGDYFEELACDQFALQGIRYSFFEDMLADEFRESALEEAFVSAYQGFLNLRATQYIDAATLQTVRAVTAPGTIGEDHLYDLAAFAVVRADRAAKAIIGMARARLDADAANALDLTFKQMRESQANQLFLTTGALLGGAEDLLRDPAALQKAVEEVGLSAIFDEPDLFERWRQADAYWMLLAS